MAYTPLKIGGLDFSDIVKAYTLSYEVLLSDKSGRTARGKNVVDIVARKDKLSVTFKRMRASRLKELLAAVEPYVVTVAYWNAKTDEEKTIQAYIGTPEISALRMGDSKRWYDEFDLSFIEM